jgi:antitoxin component YwqK of YwqJK toxin-antitoxin module
MTKSPHQPRRWLRWLTQFSLRTLLILVTLSAVACWWFLQPTSKDEELAGPRLKLRRQVRTLPRTPAEQKVFPEPNIISVGSWRMLDERGNVIARGTCKDGQPHGRWTLYHPSGHKAAEGQMLRGCRTGLWKVWDSEGRPVSEVTYAIAVQPPRRPPEPRPFVTGSSPIPVVGMISPLAAAAPLVGADPDFGFCGNALLPAKSPEAIESPEKPCSIRHGPCRGWHPTGAQRFEGQFENDLRSGSWTYFDDEGRELESGHFVADRREGAWQLIHLITGRAQTTEYTADRRQEDFDCWLAATQADLASGEVRRELAAAQRLADLGAEGVPLLLELLGKPSRRLQSLALRALSRQAAVPAELLPQVAAMIDQPDARLSLRAMLVVYLMQADERESLFPRLTAAIERTDNELALEASLAIVRADPERREQVLAKLLERFGEQQALNKGSGYPPDYVTPLADLGNGIIPHLDRLYAAASPDARWFVVMVLQDLVSRGEPKYEEVPPGAVALRCAIPPAAQPLMEKIKADPVPHIRDGAASIGIPYFNIPWFSPPGGFSGFGGQGGGIF